MAYKSVIWLASIITIATAISGDTANTATVNTKIDRIIDLTSQLVKVVERIYIEGSPELYEITIDPSHKEKLAYIDVTLNGQTLEFVEKQKSFDVNLVGQSLTQPLVVTSIYTKLLQPIPSEINQNERQLVRYQGFQTTLSPYLTKTITTKIKLPQSSRLESFSKATKMTTGSNKLTYGPFKDVKPGEAQLLVIHYENNSPFVAVQHLKRTVEVSPWARSINVVNEVKVAHTGAKLKGPFSRFEYQRDHSNGLSSVKNFVAEIPKSSREISFRDGIGNISTSNVRSTNTKTLLGLKPRFPLFGGWVTDFYLGYQLPTAGFINEPVSGNNYRLSIPFADVMYENMFIEDSTVRVTLPAGAKDIEVKCPIKFKRLDDEVNYSYLDIIGRPVVILKKNNIVSQHLDGKPLVIRYSYSKIYMLQEPLLVLATAAITVLLMVIYSKMSSKNPSNSSHSSRIKVD